MSGTEKRTVSAAAENATFIDAKVNTGGYASINEVVRVGLRALQECDDAVEQWLLDEVASTYDAVKSGNSKTVPIDDVFDELRPRHV